MTDSFEGYLGVNNRQPLSERLVNLRLLTTSYRQINPVTDCFPGQSPWIDPCQPIETPSRL